MKPTKPSSTAQLIARSTIFVARDSRLGQLVPSGAAEASFQLLQTTSPSTEQLLWLIDRPWFRWLVRLAEALTLPGILLHYIVRKRFLEDTVRESLRNGAEQVVIFGAGFDTLTLRLSREFPSVNFIEVDHPATQTAKTQLLESQPIPNLHLLPLDLSQSTLADALLPYAPYKSEARTIFVAEGLLMYLELGRMDELFRFVAQHSGQGSRFAFTFLEPQRDGKPNFHRRSAPIDLWLHWRGENFRWGIKRKQLGSFLAKRGLLLESITGSHELHRRYLQTQSIPRVRLARGEYIGLAQLEE